MNRTFRRLATGLATVPLFVGCAGEKDSELEAREQRAVVSACGEVAIKGDPLDSEELQALHHELWLVQDISGDFETAKMYTEGSLAGGVATEPGEFRRPANLLETRLGDVVCADTNGLVYFIDAPSADEITSYSLAVLQEWHLANLCEVNAGESSSKAITIIPNCD